MMKLDLFPEETLYKITVEQNISKRDIFNNLIANILTVGGDIANKIYLILTKDSLYIKYVGHCALGYIEEVRNIDRVLLSDIKSLEVTSNDLDELIILTTLKNRFEFIRHNSNKDNLALELSRKINLIKNS